MIRLQELNSELRQKYVSSAVPATTTVGVIPPQKSTAVTVKKETNQGELKQAASASYIPQGPAKGVKSQTAGKLKPALAKPVVGKGELMESNIDEMEYSSEEEDTTIEQALAQLQKKEKLQPVDHSTIRYEPFRKAFYVEVPELIKMSKEDVKAYRASLENIRVRGKDCPKPIKNWVQAGVSARLLNALKKLVPIVCPAILSFQPVFLSPPLSSMLWWSCFRSIHRNADVLLCPLYTISLVESSSPCSAETSSTSPPRFSAKHCLS